MTINSMVLESIGLTVCGAVFLFIISGIYFSGRRFSGYESTMYRLLIAFSYLASISEISFVLLCAGKGPYSKEATIVGRLYILFVTLYITTLALYSLSIQKKEEIEANNALRIGLTFGSYLVAGLFYAFSFFQNKIFPYGGTNNQLFAVNGDVHISIFFAFGLLVIAISYLFVREFKNMSKKNKLCLLLILIISTAVFLLQNSPIKQNDLTFFLSLVVCLIFFTNESQDSKLIKELEVSKAAAEKANKAQTEFLASISHEIRTPMNNILGFSESLLSNKKLTKNIVERDITAINNEGKELLELINNILDISRLESGKEKSEYKSYELSDVIFEVNSNITPKINKEELDFRISLNETLPSVLKGDYKKICRIIILLLNNVIKYTPYGEISMSYNGDKTPDGKFILSITIENSGNNMNKKMFDVEINDFIDLGNSAETSLDSEALGVIVAKRYIKLLDGAIEFENTHDDNTKYIIKIAQDIESEEKIGNIFEQIKNEKLDKIDLSNKKVLVVDDNKVNLKLATKLLEDYKANVETALSGKECIQKTKKEKYDLIFLDHMMPGMDGIATIKELKVENKELPPIIALTANNASGIREEYIGYGFTDYLSKPISQRELNKLLLEIFKE